ncbi:MAG TPA: hypothetical protein VH988_26955 [Thermoanaerobaculia bacterium]|jgi:hypothetical protein|nr:hypothetical protein [Thermoanaerobaculia bacterium]
MNRKNLFTAAALLTGLFVSSYAHAFVFWTCNGNKIVWSDPFTMVPNTFSVPPGGQRDASVNNAINSWVGVIGMMDMVSKSSTVTIGNTVTTGDGQNDVAVAPRANIGGNNGLTLMIHSLCFLSSSWGEADVFAASDLNFGPVKQDTLVSNSGRSTFMHEFGHAHGLDHDQKFNNMRVPQPRPVVGGPNETVDVLPDDAAGGRFLYPSGNPEVNLFASAQRLNGATDTILMNHTGSITSCSGGGGTVTLNSTVGNNGTVNVTQTERWWVSTDPNAFSGGFLIFQWNNSTFNANTVLTRQVTFKMPALPVGTYFLFHGVDVFHQVSESREDDNNVREGLIINVINC